MPYDPLKELAPEECKRFTGVHRPTCEKMRAALKEQGRDKKKRGRRRSWRWRISDWWPYSMGGNIGPIFILRWRLLAYSLSKALRT